MRTGSNSEPLAGLLVQGDDLPTKVSALESAGTPGDPDQLVAIRRSDLPGAGFWVNRRHDCSQRARFGERAHNEEVVFGMVAVHVARYCGDDGWFKGLHLPMVCVAEHALQVWLESLKRLE